MIKKLYQKLYFYAIAVTLAATILTVLTTGFIFHRGENRNVREDMLDQSQFISTALQELQKKNIPSEEFLRKVNENRRWHIIYCPGKSTCIPSKPEMDLLEPDERKVLEYEKKPVIKREPPQVSKVLTWLNPKNPEDGYLIISFRRPPPPLDWPRFVTVGAFTIFFLALLLIPFSRYLLHPFQKLLFSINKVALGDFDSKIDVGKYSEFRFLADSFNEMVNKIQTMIQNRERLIADVSHELRIPLTKMRLNLELIRKEGKANPKYVDKSVNEIEQIDHLIDDILSSSRLELSAEVNLQMKNFIDFIKDCLNKNQLLFQEYQININTYFPNQKVNIKFDPQMLERALNNIFANMTKYAPSGSQADLELKVEEKNIILIIRDRGAGVKEEECEKIFEPFYRADASRYRKTGGTGLGLSIVRKIISLHNGKVWASLPNDEEKGLIINIVLPFSESKN